LALVHDAAKGVAFLHANGFIHRDLAPRNILVENMPERNWEHCPTCKVGDFGQARKLEPGKDCATFSMDVYDRSLLAPENYHMVDAIHSKMSDVYQFGKIQWEAFSHNFGHFSKHFSEAEGLRGGLDLSQVTLRQRRTKLEIRGLEQFMVETPHRAGLEWWRVDEGIMEQPALIQAHTELAELCARCLQRDQQDRRTMVVVAGRLAELLRLMQEKGLVERDPTRQGPAIRNTAGEDEPLELLWSPPPPHIPEPAGMQMGTVQV